MSEIKGTLTKYRFNIQTHSNVDIEDHKKFTQNEEIHLEQRKHAPKDATRR